MNRGLRALAVIAFAFSCAAAHGQDSRSVMDLPAGERLTLRHPIAVDSARMPPVFAQGGSMMSDMHRLHILENYCMVAVGSPVPAAAVGTDLNGETIVVGTVTPTVRRVYNQSTGSYVNNTTYFINNNVNAGGSPLLVGIVCNFRSAIHSLRAELTMVFGATLESQPPL